MKRKNRVKNPIAHADGGVSKGKTFNRTVKTIPPQFPAIEPFIWKHRSYNSANSSVESAMMFFMKDENHADRIQDYLAKNLVYDAISFLMNYDLTDAKIVPATLEYFHTYFKAKPYEYITNALNIIMNEDVVGKSNTLVKNHKDVKDLVIKEIKNDDYIAKLEEVIQKVMKYQGAIYDPITSQRAEESSYENNKNNDDNSDDEEENSQEFQSNSPNYILIGVVILLALFVFKRSKK